MLNAHVFQVFQWVISAYGGTQELISTRAGQGVQLPREMEPFISLLVVSMPASSRRQVTGLEVATHTQTGHPPTTTKLLLRRSRTTITREYQFILLPIALISFEARQQVVLRWDIDWAWWASSPLNSWKDCCSFFRQGRPQLLLHVNRLQNNLMNVFAAHCAIWAKFGWLLIDCTTLHCWIWICLLLLFSNYFLLGISITTQNLSRIWIDLRLQDL